MKTALTQNPVSAGRIFFILSVLAVLLGLSPARSQDNVDVAPSQGTVSARPGQIVASGIRVLNTSGRSMTLQPTIILPAGWRIVTRDYDFTLPARGGDVRLLSFSIPPDAPARTYEVRYTVRDSLGHEAGSTIRILIAPVIQLSVQLFEAPRFAVAGRAFSTTFLISNSGNAATAVRLSFRSSGNYPISIDSVVNELGARETRQVKLTVAADAKSGRVSHTLELEVVALADSTIRVRGSSVIDIVSGSTKGEEEYFEFPVNVRVREVGQDGLFSTQGEVYGYGSLSERHTDRLEFLFRGPETQTKSVLGLRDEYRVSYRTKGLELYGGDLNYSLSTLTEFGRYATGAGGRATVGSVSAGGFYNETRWSAPVQKEMAGFVSYDLTHRASIGLNYLAKREQFSSDLTTIRGLLAPWSGSSLDVEYGTGTKDGNRDDAYALRFVGTQQWIAYDLRFVKAGPNFGGYYRDINFVSANVNVQALSNVRIESYVRQEDRNLSMDTSQVSAPRDQAMQIGASYSDFIALYVRRSIQQDRFNNPKYRRQEDAVQGRLGYNFSSLSVSINADYGSTRDEFPAQNSPYKRIALYSSFRPMASQNYSTSLEYSKERNLLGGQDQERLSASLYAWMFLGQTTQLQLNLYASRLNIVPVQTYNLFEGSLEHVFPFNHKIIFRARQTLIISSSKTQETAYLVEYSIPIAVPVKRITAVGQLRGYVRDENGRGIANVLVSAGDNASLTNNAGEYFFASIKPGPAYVMVDRATIGLDRVPTQMMPLEVNILGGEEGRLDIDVTRSVSVSGTVVLYAMKDQALGDTATSYVDLGGKSGVFLELASGTETNRRVTDSRGKFSFADLKAGIWRLNVTGGDIPEYHLVVPDSLELKLKPGAKKDVTLQLRPRRRTIKILEEGTIVPQGIAPAKIESKVQPKQAAEDTTLPCIISFDTRQRAYILQISSWLTRTKAQKVAKWAEKISGKKSFTVTKNLPNLGRRVRVFLAHFATAKEAEAMCRKLKAAE